ncbi:MAG: hypothetical protein WDZ62_01800 [Candidatus Pacearchaeota archaeon]
MIIKNKSGFQMSFAWIFAIIVGVFILFLAIYGVTQFSDTGEDVSDISAGSEIGGILSALETGVESGQVTSLRMPLETRIINGCNPEGTFGTQSIGISQKNRGSWSESDLEVTFRDKYLFSERNVQGRSFFFFSKPFELPFEVADLTYVTSSEDNYCFVDAPENIKEELENLGQENMFTEDSFDSCQETSIKVCFENFGEDCEVEVDYLSGKVVKNRESVYFETDSLMYAAIFSEPQYYECQVERLIKKTDELSSIYESKANIISAEGCNSNVDLGSFRNLLGNYRDSSNLLDIAITANNIDSQNSRERCKLW